MKWLLIGLVRLYQLLISPLLGPSCRYYPSCSAYAVQALQTHGAIRGTWLAGRRLLRCHPWSPGGVDHVPPRRSRSERPSSLRPAPAGGPDSPQGA
ncbi:membrane protein insertion efficiency factor YidD [Nocardioides caeni]|uniref:Putative membrane protein insertion efficiency factor n=1 Tax=Nocardioides caeni TaxID=574700 RepID=A0A4S8N5G6_9ACTN|nr:membrane protein insertion efficiency factor YidD [Nocardioides caeni]THV10129.1 membrane protein insertion efficiency factor YidD [Nocardioides caeni]